MHCSLQIEIRQREAAEAELEEVTWAPQISRMARNMRRPESDTELWSRLAKPAPHKNKVRTESHARALLDRQPASHISGFQSASLGHDMRTLLFSQLDKAAGAAHATPLLF